MFETLAKLAIPLAIALLAAVAYIAYRAWNFSKWMRTQIIDEIKAQRETDHFRTAARLATAPEITSLMQKCIDNHNESSEAHGTYRLMVNAFTRAHVAESIEKHDGNPVAHHVALDRYPDRRELQGALDRLETKFDAGISLILDRLNRKEEGTRE
jgi:hypothetical protein